MNIPIEEQLDAYTTWKTPELLERYGIDWEHVDCRQFFTFNRNQLVEHLKKHPDYVDSYLARSLELRGIYDKEILEHENGHYVLYWQDHASRRDEHFYADRFEAGADWLTTQYGMWLHEEI